MFALGFPGPGWPRLRARLAAATEDGSSVRGARSDEPAAAASGTQERRWPLGAGSPSARQIVGHQANARVRTVTVREQVLITQTISA